ncbi:MAG: 3-deoxy-D-manno-octulosonic acid transferase [Paludibacteraceae bacterium]|nr:3-deoxy-D-manno-octulosonic acid transferase [Paludibacteraceae bacterium]
MILYFLLVRIAALFGHKKARKLVKGQASSMGELRDKRESFGAHPIWFHASSVGEFEQARPIIEKLKQQHPRKKVVLTFFSPSGYELRKNYKYADLVLYLPFATRRRAKAFIQLLQPEMAIFVKYEFWPAYLRELQHNGISTYLISAIFRRGQLFFLPWGRPYRRLLHCFTRLYVQDEASCRLLQRFGIESVKVAGDTRFDRVAQVAADAKEIPLIKQFAQQNGMLEMGLNMQTIVAGSTWPEDELLLARYMEERPNVKLVLVPHEINETHLHLIFQRYQGNMVRYTEGSQANIHSCRVLLLDTLGMLSSVYRYADVAYIGGGFGAGIHNTLEAAVYGIPVIFGPNYYKFREAKGLIAAGGACSIRKYAELRDALDAALEHHVEMGAKSKIYVTEEQGATEMIYHDLFESAQVAVTPEITNEE